MSSLFSDVWITEVVNLGIHHFWIANDQERGNYTRLSIVECVRALLVVWAAIRKFTVLKLPIF